MRSFSSSRSVRYSNDVILKEKAATKKLHDLAQINQDNASF